MPDDIATAGLNMMTLRLRHQHPSNENNLLPRHPVCAPTAAPLLRSTPSALQSSAPHSRPSTVQPLFWAPCFPIFVTSLRLCTPCLTNHQSNKQDELWYWSRLLVHLVLSIIRVTNKMNYGTDPGYLYATTWHFVNLTHCKRKHTYLYVLLHVSLRPLHVVSWLVQVLQGQRELRQFYQQDVTCHSAP